MANTTVITGKEGSIKHGSTELEILRFSFNKTTTPVNVTDGGSGDAEEFKPGKRYNWKGNIDYLLKGGESSIPFNSEVALELVADTAVKWTGQAIIIDEGVTVETQGDSPAQINVQFQGTGVITKSDTTT